MKYNNSLAELIGKTPLLKLNRFTGKPSNIYAKLEYFNPLGSVKDRAAYAMIVDAERAGKICAGGTVIEATSGNTGIGLAFVAACRGYKLVLTMPESMSKERRDLLAALGAELVLTPAKLGMKGALDAAKRLLAETDNSFMPSQFDNPSNPDVHFRTTGPEIFEQLDGNVDVFIAGIGTGGTFSGVTKYLKKKNPKLYAVAVEPFDSRLIAHGVAGAHKIQGIGANFIPKNLNIELIDEIFPIKYNDAADTVRRLARREGLLVGISSGASAFAAEVISSRSGMENKNIVCVLPDSGERYMSTGVFAAEEK